MEITDKEISELVASAIGENGCLHLDIDRTDLLVAWLKSNEAAWKVQTTLVEELQALLDSHGGTP